MCARKKEGTTIKEYSRPFPIVAIGASAGGLEAVGSLLKHLPADTGMAYVYIQHLDPEFDSRLAEILSRFTKMRVKKAEHRLPIERDQLYIIPPNKDMAIIDGVLMLKSRRSKPAVHMPVDIFFLSLAEKQKEGAIGIILSGAAHDGTLGLKAIKAAGGITMAQDGSAKFGSMPGSAIAAGAADMILSPPEMAGELERLARRTDFFQTAMDTVGEGPALEMDKDLPDILELIGKETTVDFSHYKINTIRRRIIRRMLLHKCASLREYIALLKDRPGELKQLYQDLLINVTTFFRHAEALEYFRQMLLPEILQSKAANEPLRIWVPACSTGEEAYSLAMIVQEALAGRRIVVQIFGTDLSEQAIARARLGVYEQNELGNVSPERLERFFFKTDGSYRIIKQVRDMVVFAPHNLFKDPPFSRLDIVSCCNVLIYLDAMLQKRIMATFHYALNQSGYLILGYSENIGTSGRLFSQIDKKYKIFTKINNGGSNFIFDMNIRLPGIVRVDATHTRKSAIKRTTVTDDLEKTIDHLLLQKFVPASVLVNQDLDILQFRGAAGRFLEPAPGKASLNLLKMAKPGLALDLRTGVYKVYKSGKPYRKSGIEVNAGAETVLVSIDLVPVQNGNEAKLCLVIFSEIPAPPAIRDKASSRNRIVKQLEEELAALKEDMRAVIEEQEAGTEELQSANEEIVSSNEELQSINEELETSKEELESSNEELMTINTELQVRNEQLAESYEYAEAVFDTIREAVLVLDKDLQVKSANSAFYRIFRIREEETLGLPIFEVGHKRWDIPALRQLLLELPAPDNAVSGIEVTHNFPLLGEKVMKFHIRRVIQKMHRQQLTLLAIEDITEHRHAEQVLSERESWFRNMADHAPVMIWVAGENGLRHFFNHTWLAFTGRKQEEERGNGWKEIMHPDDRERCIAIFKENFDKRLHYQQEYRLLRNDGEFRWILETGKPDYTVDGVFRGYIGSCTEIHDKRMMNDELERLVANRTKNLKEINHELNRSNQELQQFAYVASHDLQEPLRKIMIFADRLREFRENLPQAALKYMDKISASTQRMATLIDDLLNFSKILQGDKAFEQTDINEILREVMKDFDVLLVQKKGSVKMSGLPVLAAVPVQMKQLFHNLIGNALKFTDPERPPLIEVRSQQLQPEEFVRFRNLDPNRRYYKIIVADNGIGFDEKFSEQIFTIFQRLNTKDRYPGTGIGLALCKKIMENHGGVIYAKPSTPVGAAFHLILPAER